MSDPVKPCLSPKIPENGEVLKGASSFSIKQAELSSISSQPVQAQLQPVRRATLIERLKIAQNRDPHLPKQLPFSYNPIPNDLISKVIQGTTTSFLVLGNSYFQPFDEVSKEYHPFYINLAQIKDPENAIEETLRKYKEFDDEEIRELRLKFKFLLVFYNCYAKPNAAQSHLGYKNKINDLDGWKGKAFFYCNPFSLPGNPLHFHHLFIPFDAGLANSTLFTCYTINDSLPIAALNEILENNLSPNVYKYVHALEENVEGFQSLIRIPSFLEALLETLKESPTKFSYDTWIDKWLDFREKELAEMGIHIDNFKKVWKDFYSGFAKALAQEPHCQIKYQPNPFESNKWDAFFDYDDPVKSALLRVSPLTKSGTVFEVFSSLLSYLETGKDPIFTESVDIYYV